MQSVASLQDALQRDLVWRKREISAVRAGATSADDGAHHVYRSGLVLLCSHWEGFLKKAANLYIEHVFSQDLELRSFKPNVVAVAYYRHALRAAEAKYPGSTENHVRLAVRILETLNERIGEPGWSADTEGNPGSDVLQKILRSIGVDEQLGLDAAGWATTRVFINEHLVRDRHHVAHGDSLRLTRESFLERVQRLLDLLEVVLDQVLDAAVNQRYKAA